MLTTRTCAVLVVVGLVVGYGATAGAQQRLSDAAKGISLQHPEGEEIIVMEGAADDPDAVVFASGDDLLFLAQNIFDSGQAAEAVLEEARNSEAFFDEPWRDRMTDAARQVELALRELVFANIPERYQPAVSVVLDGGRRYQLAGDMVNQAIDDDTPVFSGALGQFEEGNRRVTHGLVELRREREAEAAEQPLPPPDPLAASQAITALCGKRYGKDERAGYDLCTERQNAALQNMNRRFGFNSGLEEPEFNTIRLRCRDRWPEDMVARDRCEVAAIDSARAR